MATYFIGDVHGCCAELNLLLDKINYDSTKDRLMLTGDLVGRGPDPLATLKLARGLLRDNPANQVVLGNHDLHMISLYCGGYEISKNPDPTLMQVLANQSVSELIGWLISLPLMYHDQQDNFTLVHAGIPHIWTNTQALQKAAYVKDKIYSTYLKWLEEIEAGAGDVGDVAGLEGSEDSQGTSQASKATSRDGGALGSASAAASDSSYSAVSPIYAPFLGNQIGKLLASLYGNSPGKLEDAQNETEQLRTTLNYFTRMRMCNPQGKMELGYNGPPTTMEVSPDVTSNASADRYAPWFSYDRIDGGNRSRAGTARKNLIVFGHWAAAEGVTDRDDIWAMDYGCAWGRKLAAKRLEDSKMFFVDCLPPKVLAPSA